MGCKSAAKSKLEEETAVSSSLQRCKRATEPSVERKAIHEQCDGTNGESDLDDEGEEEEGNGVVRLIPSGKSFPSGATITSARNSVTR